ncbi:hypothetical protein [Saccharicrinis sp. FJH54]|uniref:hypothetical protein n=1 Tax=Saccharicrinis sp. FJH54 TaxID=3344665 RepID=UPI0035D41C84
MIKQDIDQAITQLFNKIKYLSNNGYLNDRSVNQYKWIISTIQQYKNETEQYQLDTESKMNALNEDRLKLFRLLELTGLKEDLIKELLSIPLLFLEQYLENIHSREDYLQKEILWDELILKYRSVKRLVNFDIDILSKFKSLCQDQTIKHDIKIELLTSFKKCNPHLKQFFIKIENNAEFNIHKVTKQIQLHYAGS